MHWRNVRDTFCHDERFGRTDYLHFAIISEHVTDRDADGDEHRGRNQNRVGNDSHQREYRAAKLREQSVPCIPWNGSKWKL